MSSDSIFKTKWNDVSEGEGAYTRPCVSAVVSAVLGLATFLVFFTTWFSFLGIIAVFMSLFAFWAIRNAEGTLTGTTFAYVGLCSAVVALTAVTVFWTTYQHGLRREADQFFRLWLEAVQQGDIPKAKEYHAIYPYRSKAADAEEWWQTQYENRYTHRSVHLYVEDKLVRTLMALGNQAKVSFYKTLDIVSGRESDTVVSVYAVTFPTESGGTETFFVRISGKRSYPQESADFKSAGWKIDGTPAFYLPEEFKKDADTP